MTPQNHPVEPQRDVWSARSGINGSKTEPMKTHVTNGGPRIIPLSPNGMFGLSDLASMATNLTQNKPSEGFRRFGLAKMTARMDEPTPFQASKWFQLACMATMLTPNKPSEAFRRFGLATMTAWMDGPTPIQASKSWFRPPQGLRRFDLTPNVGHRCQSKPPCNGSRVFVHASMLSS